MDGFPVTVTEALCLGASLALSGAFYYLYNKRWAIIHKLDVSIRYHERLYTHLQIKSYPLDYYLVIY